MNGKKTHTHTHTHTAYTNTKPSVDTAVVVEPWLPSEPELPCSNPQSVFEKIMVARTVATWCTSDGAVQVQVANPSSEHVALPAGLRLGSLSPVHIATVKRAPINDTYVSSVAASPQTPTDRATAKAELMEQLASAFVNSTFSPEQKNEIMDLCARFRPVFSSSSEELGKCKTAVATFLLLPGTKPVNIPPYRANPRQEKVIDECVEDMVSRGVAEKRSSPWGSPVTIVARKDGQPRFCVDYRRTLNKLLIRKPWPMATLERNLDSLGAARFISVADVATAYWQIPVHPDHVERTAFVTSRGEYCFNRMLFGVCNAPWLFTEMAQKTLGHIPELLIYMDDLCVLSSTWESHISSLENLFAALQAAGLTLKPSKMSFGPKSVTYLGHVISAEEVSVGTDRIQAIQKLKTPESLKELRSILGVLNFVRRFVPNFADVTAPLVALTCKGHDTASKFRKSWEPPQDAALVRVKQLLSSPPILNFPDFDREFQVHVDASEEGVGAFLAQPAKSQTSDQDVGIVAYYSQQFKSGQRHYSASMKECCAVVLALTHWRPFLFGKHFTVFTDHRALVYLYHMQDASNMLTRWAIALQNFDFTVEHIPGKLNIVPDTLPRLFGDVNPKLAVNESALASICRNVPNDRPYHRARPRDFEISLSR